jgi:hypothetical protein
MQGHHQTLQRVPPVGTLLAWHPKVSWLHLHTTAIAYCRIEGAIVIHLVSPWWRHWCRWRSAEAVGARDLTAEGGTISASAASSSRASSSSSESLMMMTLALSSGPRRL